MVLANRYRDFPPAVNLGQAEYPQEAEIDRLVWWMEAYRLAGGLGNAAVAGFLPVADLVPSRYAELNRRAFAAGRTMVRPAP